MNVNGLYGGVETSDVHVCDGSGNEENYGHDRGDHYGAYLVSALFAHSLGFRRVFHWVAEVHDDVLQTVLLGRCEEVQIKGYGEHRNSHTRSFGETHCM